MGTSSFKADSVSRISSSVVNTEKLNRRVESSPSFGMPMAFSVALTAGLLVAQAEPEDT